MEKAINIDGVNQIKINDQWYAEDNIIDLLKIKDCQAIRELTDSYIIYDNGLVNVVIYFDENFKILKRGIK